MGRYQAITKSNSGRVDLLAQGVQAVFSPVIQGANRSLRANDDWWAGLIQASSLRAENERLRQLAEGAELYEERVSALENQLDAIRKLNGFPAITSRQRVPAEVVSLDPRNHRIQITAGSNQGVKEGMAVITGDGLAGRVEAVSANRSFVLLVTSPSFRIGASVMAQPIVAGIIRGNSGSRMTLGNAENASHVKPGDQVTTSTFSEFIPPYIPVGRIVRRTSQPELGLEEFEVRVNLRTSTLREVFVIQ